MNSRSLDRERNLRMRSLWASDHSTPRAMLRRQIGRRRFVAGISFDRFSGDGALPMKTRRRPDATVSYGRNHRNVFASHSFLRLQSWRRFGSDRLREDVAKTARKRVTFAADPQATFRNEERSFRESPRCRRSGHRSERSVSLRGSREACCGERVAHRGKGMLRGEFQRVGIAAGHIDRGTLHFRLA